MNILLTGATGFIGKALTRRLLENGKDRIVILARDMDRIEEPVKKKAEVFEIDLARSSSLKCLSALMQGIDIVFHLAASLDFYGPKKALWPVNVKAGAALFKTAGELGVRKFIFSSSIEAMEPVSSYGQSKLCAEKELLNLSKGSATKLIIFRIGNVYGPGSFSYIISIARAILKKDQLYRFLSVYKDFLLHPVYIEDVVEGLLCAACRPEAEGTYDLSGAEYTSIYNLFAGVAGFLGVELKAEPVGLSQLLYLNFLKLLSRLSHRADLLTYFISGGRGRFHRAYSIGKAERELGYCPKVKIGEGISRTLSWAKTEGILV